MACRWSFCKRCGFPFIPGKPRQEFCSWLCERNDRNEKEDPGRRSGGTMTAKEEHEDEYEYEADDRLKNVVDSVEECRKQVLKLCKIMDGLSEFAGINDENGVSHAGDWTVVINTADMVSRCLRYLNANLVEAVDPGDTGDA